MGGGAIWAGGPKHTRDIQGFKHAIYPECMLMPLLGCRPPKGLDMVYGERSPVERVAPQITVVLGSVLAFYIAQSLLHEVFSIMY